MSKTCLYEILGCDRDASPNELKKAYRKLALKHHPDKNAHRLEEATRQFRLVQQAYEVLKDPQEREWYDGHREQILRGGESGSTNDGEAVRTGVDPFELDLYKYRACGVYDEESDFYATYAGIFEKIDEIEQKMSGRRKEEEKGKKRGGGARSGRRRRGNHRDRNDFDRESFDADAGPTNAPSFGDETSEWKHVETFYKYWRSFVSKRPFAWCDKYKPSDAPDRRTRRLIEKENKSARMLGKKRFSSEVRSLCTFVHRRDPRIKVRKAKLARDREVEEIENARKREEATRLKIREREEAEREWEAAVARGEVEEVVVEETVWRCEWCNKIFRSERSHAQHVRSKKHKKRVAELTKRRGGEEATQTCCAGEGAGSGGDDDEALLEEMLQLDLEEERQKRSRESDDAKIVGDEKEEAEGTEEKGLSDDEPNGGAETQTDKKETPEDEGDDDDEEEEEEESERPRGNAFGALMYSSSSDESSEEDGE